MFNRNPFQSLLFSLLLFSFSLLPFLFSLLFFPLFFLCLKNFFRFLVEIQLQFSKRAIRANTFILFIYQKKTLFRAILLHGK